MLLQAEQVFQPDLSEPRVQSVCLWTGEAVSTSHGFTHATVCKGGYPSDI